MALLDCQVAMLANLGVGDLGPARRRSAWAIAPEHRPYQVFHAADGHIILAVGNDRQFARFCAVAGAPSWRRSAFARNADGFATGRRWCPCSPRR